ncbi:hypothetical protein BTJ40_03325 [Microbulbifer sp. A4B17]|uniref:hypothetical protein n=1 Tax=Microbulbifer sp. A4B17 TaxID=359370 RepID=UPI000D52DF0F|nr:hypothetical protein [Microbulbifer sp. A4B17]AWF79924.1 hypothetical protein BTJ40_03325 [Microbulbifer sp. A4B17]
MKKLFSLVITAIIAISTNTAVWAENDRDVQLTERLETTKARLNLSEEQVEKITPILEASYKERGQVLAKYGINIESPGGALQKMSFREKRQMAKEMAAIKESVLNKMSAILTDQQLSEFKKIQEESSAAFRAKLQEGRN